MSIQFHTAAKKRDRARRKIHTAAATEFHTEATEVSRRAENVARRCDIKKICEESSDQGKKRSGDK